MTIIDHKLLRLLEAVRNDDCSGRDPAEACAAFGNLLRDSLLRAQMVLEAGRKAAD